MAELARAIGSPTRQSRRMTQVEVLSPVKS
jgi:hypothetical protein